MSVLHTLARAEAVAARQAVPAATVRHCHLSDRPLVLVPLTTAGEAGAPLGAMLGTDRDAPELLVVPQPLDRELRFGFFAGLATQLLRALDRYADEVEVEPATRNREETELCADALQVVVPNSAAVEYVRLVGRSTRFLRTVEDQDAPHPVPVPVPLLGRWLTHYAERSRTPGSGLLLAMTDLLTRHWATGQSAMEDQHLGALLGWIDPPPGLDGPTAAARAQTGRAPDGLLLSPPAGPATDPVFDNRVLAPAQARYDKARSAAERAAAEAGIRDLVASQLRPTWDDMWRGLDLLRDLPEGAHVAERWKRDRWSFTGHRDRVRAGEPPQPKRDDAITAAQKLAGRETAQARLAAQEALDDPLAMAARRLSGEAFTGTVVEVEMTWSEGRRPMPRPVLTLLTGDLPQAEPGAKAYRALPDARSAQGAELLEVLQGADPEDGPPHGGPPDVPETDTAKTADTRAAGADGAAYGTPADGRAGGDGGDGGGGGGGRLPAWSVRVKLTGGMGSGRTPREGSVPAPGDTVTFTLFEHDPRSGPALPDAEQTPWTHGGPPGSDTTPPAPDPVTAEDFL
ncbi:hypothetical protein RVR_3372 [Actinacidiphila reveromycinica]|uniref:Uncharacterized protein n=1 Tax=Actinacidiphila reveromycinica TaxID=659352 RepID=A0A7U3URV6_9ACTN|nr:hypothetical protein [Streptomyces sp. SN-593]BBA97568.1 hypothetical protein RVR_3372 [Streptomyces sp. SN-593]